MQPLITALSIGMLMLSTVLCYQALADYPKPAKQD